MEIRNYLRDQAGSRSLVFDLSITHDRFGSSSHVQQNGPPGDRGALNCHWNAIATQPIGLVPFQARAFYQSLKSKVGLAAAKAAALRINLNVLGCGIVAAPVHAPFRAPLLLPFLLSHNLPLHRVHKCVMGRLVH